MEDDGMEDDGMTPEELNALVTGLARERDALKAEELNALADDCAQQHADYVLLPDGDLPDGGLILLHAAAVLRELAEVTRERDGLHAAGCDLVALVEMLERLDRGAVTPAMKRMMRARLNEHRKVLGLPSPDYSQGGLVDLAGGDDA
jgi:hypothetical protein